ncbi:MAG: hypothetical protein Q8L45_07500 [Xanthomonadaceae bacterium]|nr:hypothetical protein [Xanthomonadaceae bacterium]MDP2183986.1 hypothetical protein [Xanthomonadales bacterium]MDZ4116553.1 hypothetical protein [Xanthomonadaceae bacterium]MDZ4376773.1 hypothetical protein [Xanthomonadaceae bacterium]
MSYRDVIAINRHVLGGRRGGAAAAGAFMTVLMSLGIFIAITQNPMEGQSRQFMAYVLTSTGLFFWWMFIASRILAFSVAFTAICIPRDTYMVWCGLCGQFVVTVVLPSLILAAAVHAPVFESLWILGTVAMAGLLFSLLPPWTFLAWIAAAGMLKTHPAPDALLDALMADPPWPYLAPTLASFCALLWLWLRRRGIAAPAWQQPTAIQLIATTGSSFWTSSTASTAPKDVFGAWLAASPQLPDNAGHGHTAILRQLLGAPFHFIGWRGLLRQQMPIILILVFWGALSINDPLSPGVTGPFSAMLMLASGFAPAMRLRAMHSNISAERAELPLLPGLPNGQALTHAISMLCLRTTATSMVLTLALLMIFALFTDASSRWFVWMMVIATMSQPLLHAAALSALARQSAPLTFAFISLIGLLVLAFGSGFLAALSNLDAMPIVVIMVWTMIAVFGWFSIKWQNRRLRLLPNPFVQP